MGNCSRVLDVGGTGDLEWIRSIREPPTNCYLTEIVGLYEKSGFCISHSAGTFVPSYIRPPLTCVASQPPSLPACPRWVHSAFPIPHSESFRIPHSAFHISEGFRIPAGPDGPLGRRPHFDSFRIEIVPSSAFGFQFIPHSAIRIPHFRRIPQSAFYIGEIPHSDSTSPPSHSTLISWGIGVSLSLAQRVTITNSGLPRPGASIS